MIKRKQKYEEKNERNRRPSEEQRKIRNKLVVGSERFLSRVRQVRSEQKMQGLFLFFNN